jgi:hypothetical protein
MQGRGSKAKSIRLGTSLLEAKKYPAAELLGLYRQVGRRNHGPGTERWNCTAAIGPPVVPPETAAPKIAALLLAQSIWCRCAVPRAIQGKYRCWHPSKLGAR